MSAKHFKHKIKNGGITSRNGKPKLSFFPPNPGQDPPVAVVQGEQNNIRARTSLNNQGNIGVGVDVKKGLLTLGASGNRNIDGREKSVSVSAKAKKEIIPGILAEIGFKKTKGTTNNGQGHTGTSMNAALRAERVLGMFDFWLEASKNKGTTLYGEKKFTNKKEALRYGAALNVPGSPINLSISKDRGGGWAAMFRINYPL
tara:strand:+ start:5109 stop:5711 length:603 start_codon:yes stop_codon:yes gene_type:complete